MISDGVLKHEEGHIAYKRNPDKYNELYDKAKRAIENDDTDKNDHGESPEEYIADWYSATHSKYGKNGFNKTINSLRQTEKDIKDKIKKLDKENIKTDEMKSLEEDIKTQKESIDIWNRMINTMKKNGQNVDMYEKMLKGLKDQVKVAEDKMSKFKTDEYRNKILEPRRAETRKDAAENNNEMNLRKKFVNDHVKESTDMLIKIYEAEMNGDITKRERDYLIMEMKTKNEYSRRKFKKKYKFTPSKEILI